MPSKHEKNRKRDLDADTSIEEDREESRRHRRSRSRSPKKSKRRKEDDSSPSKNEESMSIEETNKLRAKLGLAPLDLDDKTNTEPVEKEDGSGEKVFTEDGVEIVHKPSRNWSEEKRQKELKEKLENKKRQRDLHSKVLKSKNLAEEEDEEIENTKKWIERSRRIEEEMKKAKEKEKELEEMDESFGIGALLREEQLKKQKKKRGGNVETETSSGGLIVGHSVQDFQEGRETILVLQDKSLLLDGEDADEEILINPNMVENERTKLNVERRKKKATHYQAYEEEEIDEFGQIKRKEILDKYNEGMDGENKKKETFRLDETGHYDLDKEAKEAEAKRKLMMVNKKFESLGETKYTLANEFYTEEEVIQFRRLKKKKTSKNSRKKALKTTELEPLEETEEEKKIREEKLAARRREQEGGEEGGKAFRDTMKESNGSSKVSRSVVMEEGEIVESKKEIKQSKDSIAMPPPDQTKWKKPKVNVDVKMLDILAEKIKKREEEEDEEEEFLPTNVAPIQIEDDDASEELNAILAKARLLKNSEKMVKKEVTYFASDSSDDEDMEEQKNSNAIIFDATSEKYKAIGGGGYGNDQQMNKKIVKTEIEEEMEIGSEIASSSLKKEFLKRRRTDSGSSGEFERMDEERDGDGSDSDEEKYSATKNYSNILGEEKDVTKGVAAMLKLAGQKGYLESGNKKRHGEGSLKHLESKRYSKVEQGRYDIEDKTMRKLERMGTTGTGPTRPFPEKTDYTPKIEINYSDKSGRVLEPKEAFRVLSWKFHGKGPGKKQGEKHKMKVDKREKLKKMNSQDTPLGTLNKQLKKQEQLSSAYLLLSGRGDAAPLQKE